MTHVEYNAGQGDEYDVYFDGDYTPVEGDVVSIYIKVPAGEPVDDNEHVVIDEYRNVHVPDELKNIAVQYDHNVEKVTFDCVRYWDGIDLSEMVIYIKYIRADGRVGMYIAPDVSVMADNPSGMTFSWVLSKNATMTKGKLAFLVCAKQVDAKGNELHCWNSRLCDDMRVSEGLNVGTDIVELYPDVIGDILMRIEGVKDYDDVVSKGYLEERLGGIVNEVLAALPNAEEAEF